MVPRSARLCHFLSPAKSEYHGWARGSWERLRLHHRTSGAHGIRPAYKGFMSGLELVLLLMVVAAGLAVAARRLSVPYPLLLVLGGLALAWLPGLPLVTLAPQSVLLVFLPPLLFAAAWFTSWRDF